MEGCSDCCHVASGDCGKRHWRIELDGFGTMICAAPTLAKARWRNYTLGHEVGYFSGGFHDWLTRLLSIVEVKP